MKIQTIFACALVLAYITASTYLLAMHPREPRQDQLFVQYKLWRQGYPYIATGVSSHLIASAANLVTQEPIAINTLVRSLVATLYLTAAGLLSWSLTRRWYYIALFLALLFTGRWPFVWLSTELFAGAWLMLYLWAVIDKRPLWLRAGCIVLFGFAKADTLFPALLLAAYEVLLPWRPWGQAIRRTIIVGTAFAIILLPGVMQYGPSYLFNAGGRSFEAFSQHYAGLVRLHQLVRETPSTGHHFSEYTAATFGNVHNVGEAIRSEPWRYIDYLGLGLAYAVHTTWDTYLLLLLPLALWCWRAVPHYWRTLVLLLAANILPILTLSALNMRYQARFYPLVLFVVLTVLPRMDGRRRYVVVGLLVVLLSYQLWQLLAGDVLRTAFWYG